MTKRASFEIFVSRRNFLFVFFLLFNSFTWFYMMGSVANSLAPPTPLRMLSLYGMVAVSLFIGSLIVEKVDKERFLFIWILIGAVFSFFPLFMHISEPEITIFLILLGFSFGIGLASCLALVPALTRIEERGKIGGTISFLTFVLLPLFLMSVKRSPSYSNFLLAGIWRAVGLLAFLFTAKWGISAPQRVSYSFIVEKRFLFYFLPWLMFCLINQFEHPILNSFFGEQFIQNLMLVELIAGSIFCFVGGWLMDFKGRRPTIIAGLVALGLGYAVLGLFPAASLAQMFYLLVDGAAWGIFTVAFVFVIWGDIAGDMRAEKFYALGSIPYFIAHIIPAYFAPTLASVDVRSAFSLAALFIFLAIIPLFFAPELLQEKVLKEREIKKYVEEAKKVARR